MNRMKYNEPVLEIIELEASDVICTSVGDDNFGDFEDALSLEN